MDLFKKTRFLGLLVVLLIILNTTLLALIWVQKLKPPSHRPPHPQHRSMDENSGEMRRFLEAELGFDESQSEEYLLLRRRHRERIEELSRELNSVKKEMFDTVLEEDTRPTLSDSLLDLSLEKQAEIERLTFQHFLDLKELCEPGQQEKLKLLMHELFRRRPPPPGRGGRPRPGFEGDPPSGDRGAAGPGFGDGPPLRHPSGTD